MATYSVERTKTRFELVEENEIFRYELRWQNAILSNGNLSFSQRIIMVALRRYILANAASRGTDGLYLVRQPVVARMAGCGRKAVITALQEFENSMLIRKETPRDKISKHLDCRVAFMPIVENDPSGISICDRKKPGGYRIKIHKGCGGTVTNMCTSCGVHDIPISQIEYLDSETVQRNTGELERMDQYIAETDRYYEAADIDDDVVEQFGGPEAVLRAKPADIAKALSVPLHVRQGLTDEDLAMIDRTLDEMRRK